MNTSPRNAGTSDNSMVTETIAAQDNITTGLALTTRKDVSMAVTKLVSRSSSIGMATTVTENNAAESRAPTQVPTARKTQPSGVNSTVLRKPSKSEKDAFCRMIASQSLT